MANMSEKAVSCIVKQSNERTAEEINDILPWLRLKSEIINKLNSETLFEILKNCTFAEKQRDDVIIYQGEIGDTFYVILKGSVSIYIQTDVESLAFDEPSQPATDSKNQKKELDRSRFGKCVSSFDAGKSFGELALINDNSKRNASIIADELTHLLIINRDLFNRSIKEIELQKYNQKFNFVNRSEIFSNWFLKFKKQVAFSLRKESYGYNMPLATQGAPTNGLIFLLKGQAKVVVNVHQHSYQFPRMNLTNNNEDIKISEINDLERSVDEYDSKKLLQNLPSKRRPYTEAEQRQVQRSVEISIVTNGEIIGDFEQGLELSTYTQSVITIEPTEVYILDASNFDRLIKRNPKTQKLLRTRAINKLKHREKWLEARPIPFYTKLKAIIQDLEQRQAKEEQNQQESSKAAEREDTTFLEHRGPLINMYGPGSVFFRNRQLRKEKLMTEKKKKYTHMTLKGQPNTSRSGNTMAIVAPKIDDTLDANSSDEEPEKLFDQMDKGTNMNQYKLPGNNEQPHDWETGSDHLQSLEKRLQNWFLSVNALTLDKGTGSGKMIDQYTVLKRFKPDDNDKRIIPGKKIFLRPKIPLNKPKTVIEDESREKVFITARRFKSSSFSKKSPDDLQETLQEFKEGFPQSLVQSRRDPFALAEPKGQRKLKIDEPQLPIHQYTTNEYKVLKQLLKKREVEMRVFQTAMSI